MERKLSNRGVTMPYVDEVCRVAFKKVEGKWYLPSEEIRGERLNLEVLDEPSAIEWIRSQLSARAMTLPELIPSWRQATLKVGNRLEKTLPQLLEENFWRDAEPIAGVCRAKPSGNTWVMSAPYASAATSNACGKGSSTRRRKTLSCWNGCVRVPTSDRPPCRGRNIPATQSRRAL